MYLDASRSHSNGWWVIHSKLQAFDSCLKVSLLFLFYFLLINFQGSLIAWLMDLQLAFWRLQTRDSRKDMWYNGNNLIGKAGNWSVRESMCVCEAECSLEGFPQERIVHVLLCVFTSIAPNSIAPHFPAQPIGWRRWWSACLEARD